eukprot:TRINITY_DN2763_c0_g1_i1.p1 TRINITY_DN2763_c0_g1~~TRINITY_DN2763_c0_g1_i1.p1  ORF type:complete len:282 (+),score=49.85 TRINITY_DN2763_c0_g1_i1:375-1220(+)
MSTGIAPSSRDGEGVAASAYTTTSKDASANGDLTHVAAGGDVVPSDGAAAANGEHLPHHQRHHHHHHHGLCHHPHSCISNTVRGFLRSFAMGYGLRVVLALLSGIFARGLYKKPKRLFEAAFLSPDVVRFGVFLGSYTAGMKGINCLMRYIRKTEDGLNSIVAGFLAGTSLVFFRSNELALYLLVRALESAFNAAHKRGLVPSYAHGDSVLFAIATSIMFYAYAWEQDTLRPSYRKFINKVSGGRDYDREAMGAVLTEKLQARDAARRRRLGLPAPAPQTK